MTCSRVAAIGAAALLASACAGGLRPEATPAPPGLEASWIDPPVYEAEPGETAGWWRSLRDPELTRLVDAALSQNLAVREAVALIAAARADRDAARAGFWPGVRGEGHAVSRRQSANGPLPVNVIPGLERDQEIYDVGFDAAWEIDLFGRVRAANRAVEAHLAGRTAQAAAARAALAAEVVRTYASLRATQAVEAAQADTVAALAQAADLTAQRVALGDAAEPEAAAAAATLAGARATHERLQAEMRAGVIALAALTGQAPEAELDLLAAPGGAIALLDPPIGARADLIRRRADIRAAEWALAGRAAERGLAVAELFPRLTLSAAGGFEALAGADLLSSDSQRGAIAPFISWRVFEAGRVRAEIRAASAREEAQARAYEGAVVTALAEAETALSAYRRARAALVEAQTAEAAQARALSLAEDAYAAGATSLFPVLEARVARNAAHAAERRAQAEAVAQLAALYKALGGGWEAPGETVRR